MDRGDAVKYLIFAMVALATILLCLDTAGPERRHTMTAFRPDQIEGCVMWFKAGVPLGDSIDYISIHNDTIARWENKARWEDE